MEEATTAYGARVGAPREAAAVLRALASRAGIELRAASEVDLVAAVVAADAWSRVCKVSDLGLARQAGSEAQRAAGAVLARAAGYGDDGPNRAVAQVAQGHTPTGCTTSGDTVLEMLEDYRRWAGAALGDEGLRTALWRAGSDLVCADQRLVGAAVTLQLACED